MAKDDLQFSLAPPASPFNLLLENPNGLPEAEVAILVDGLLHPEMDPQTTRVALAELQQLVAEHPKAAQEPWLALSDLGFTGNAATYSATSNSSISWVLSHRSGIPISLAVVLISVARGLGRQAHGLNHPGHFLVKVDGRLVDPFHMTLVPTQAPVFVTAGQAPETTAADIGLRMLNNLKYASLQSQDWVQALALLDHQLAMRPKAWDLWFEKASLWQQLGSYTSAAQTCRALLDQPLPQELAASVTARLEQLQARPPEILH